MQEKNRAGSMGIMMAFIMVAAFIWGLDGSLLRPALYHLAASVVVFAEHFGAFLVLLLLIGLVLLKNGGRAPEWIKKDWAQLKRLDRKGWLVMLWIALFGGLIGTFAITKALFFVGFIPLSAPILIQKIQPFFAILFARLLLKEKISKHFYLWALMAVAGSYLVTFGFHQPVLSWDNKTLVAGLLGLTAAFAWGTSTTVGRLGVVNYLSHRAMVFVRMGLTSVLALLLVLGTGQGSGIAAIHGEPLKILLIVVLLNAVLATFLYYKGLKKVPAKIATLCELVFPLTVVAGDYIFHQALLAPAQILGGILILGALYMCRRCE